MFFTKIVADIGALWVHTQGQGQMEVQDCRCNSSCRVWLKLVPGIFTTILGLDGVFRARRLVLG